MDAFLDLLLKSGIDAAKKWVDDIILYVRDVSHHYLHTFACRISS